MTLARIAVLVVPAALVASLTACGKSRGNDADCDLARMQTKADAVDAAAIEQRGHDAEQKRRDDKALAEEWRLRANVVRSTLAHAKRFFARSSA